MPSFPLVYGPVGAALLAEDVVELLAVVVGVALAEEVLAVDVVAFVVDTAVDVGVTVTLTFEVIVEVTTEVVTPTVSR